VQDLSDAGRNGTTPAVGVDPKGNAVAAWSLFDGASYRVQARGRSASGTLSSVQDLSAPGQDGYGPQVAVDEGGNGVSVWTGFDGANDRIQSTFLLHVQTLSDAGLDAFDPQVAVDPNGNAVAVWQRFDGTESRTQARRRSASGTLSSVQDLSAAGQSANSPQVAVDPNGNAVVVWSLFDGTNSRIQARRRSASGTLSSVQTLSAAGQDAVSPQVAVDANGNAVVVWQRYDGTNFRIQARRRAASGNLSSVLTLSEGGQHAQYPQVAVDTKGNASAVWIRADGLNTLIQSGRL
jgi:hypothetical protein